MQNPEHAVTTLLASCKALGITVAIDDFGTGYSSLGYLKRFPIDSVKIDRSFIKDLPHDTDDAAITRAVIAMGHSLRIRWSRKAWSRASSSSSCARTAATSARAISSAGRCPPTSSRSSRARGGASTAPCAPSRGG